MPTVVMHGDLAEWRAHARGLVLDRVRPEEVQWVDLTRTQQGERGLFAPGEPTPLPSPRRAELRVPRDFARRAETVACHRAPVVWDVLYALLYRLCAGERGLLADPLDPSVAEFAGMEKAVRRDAHKMHAFVRFRRVADPTARNGERFVAWYQPSHLIVEREAGFFRERFPGMDWSILTPDRSAHWDGQQVAFTEGAPRSEAPSHDELEELWCAYYASIFNPARVKLKAMAAEMPRKFWSTLPETAQLPSLLADVPRRIEEMAQTSRRMADSAHPYVPKAADLPALRDALTTCEGCELHRNHTRPVLGEGEPTAGLVLLGEQPGDQEEREGRPFIGPAGDVLRSAWAEAGLSRGELYLTNAVKHFRHTVQTPPHGQGRGKRRLHKRPTTQHASRCQPWLDAEMEVVRPLALVCLGVTALRTVLGPTARLPAAHAPPQVTQSKYAASTLATFHPAAILRTAEEGRKTLMRAHLVETLRASRAASFR